MRRMWINQPSTLQPLHHLHGTRVLVCPDTNGTCRVYFLEGNVIDMRVRPHVLSEGWIQ